MKKCVTHFACDCILQELDVLKKDYGYCSAEKDTLIEKVKNLEKENKKLKEKIQKIIDLKDETINIHGIKQLLRDK